MLLISRFSGLIWVDFAAAAIASAPKLASPYSSQRLFRINPLAPASPACAIIGRITQFSPGSGPPWLSPEATIFGSVHVIHVNHRNRRPSDFYVDYRTLFN